VDRASPPSVKGRTSTETRRAVLDLIRGSHGVSRADLARRSGLTEATISRIVSDLQADGVVRSIGRAASTGGKRPTLIAIDQTSTYALGVGLDSFSCVVVLCTLDGVVVSRRQVPLPAAHAPPVQILDHVADVIAGLLADQGVDPRAVSGIGLASAGRVHGSRGWSECSVISDP
jgi:transcriptional regulator with XRE-family HTH domain